jgi:hypothetical protein
MSNFEQFYLQQGVELIITLEGQKLHIHMGRNDDEHRLNSQSSNICFR